METLRVDGLTKSLGGQRIVDDVSFTLGRGDVVAFAGPNGAGKSTTIKMILGLVFPDRGSVHINEQPLTARNRWILSRVGAMIESPSFYGTATGEQNLRLFADLYGVPRTRVGEVLDLVDLGDAAGKKVDRYSLGMKQRLGIARAFLNRPDLVILDEPTNGLDPFGVREIRQLVGRLAGDEGVTFLVASHVLSELEQICGRAVILDRGRVVAQGDLPSLMAAHQSRDLEHLFLSVLSGARDADVARA
nr:ABC transporter ATP-binding protein [Propionibacterium sp.]